MRYHCFRLPAALVALCLSSSALTAAEPLQVRAFDAGTARPAEVAREVRASAPGTLFRVAGLRGADSFTVTRVKPGPQVFRVRAKFKKDVSDYSNAVTVTVP